MMPRPTSPDELAKRLLRETQAFERLVFGSSEGFTQGLLPRLEPLLSEHHPDLVSVADDLHRRLERIEQQLQEFVDTEERFPGHSPQRASDDPLDHLSDQLSDP